MFPTTASEFASLERQGKTVIYAEGERPGESWALWGTRDGVDVWRKIVSFEEAEAYWLSQQQ